MKQVIQFLSDIRPISPGLNRILSESFDVVEVSKNKFIKIGGKPPRHLFFIERGIVSVYKHRDDGKIDVTGFLKEKDIIFDHDNLLAQTPSDEFIISDEPLLMYQLHVTSLKRIIMLYEEFAYHLIALTSRNCRELGKRCEILSAYGATRVCRFSAFSNDVRFRVPINHLCSYLGISAPTLHEGEKCFGR
jgi:CRP-like cAMP-binding protein